MFKRNQVEEAIARVLEPGSTKLSSEMGGRMKRLLEVDRGRGRNKRSSDPEKENFAFYSADVPGRGHDNRFTEYEAFALLTGLRLMALGWPQGIVVALLRRLRRQLEPEHARMLQTPPIVADEAQIQRQARPGDLAVGDSLFVVIVSQEDRRGSRSVALCRGQREVFDLFHRYGPGFAFTLLELARSVTTLSSALAQTRPRRRGRAS